MKANHYLKLGIVALTSASLVACMDNKYDLNNVDLTIGTGSDLTLPESSTGEILLKSILDIEPCSDGIVQISDGGYIPKGEYYLKKEGNPTTSDVEINPITIARPTFSDIDCDVDLAGVEVVGASKVRSVAGGTKALDIPNHVYKYSIQPEDKAYYELGNNVGGSVPSEIVALKDVTFVSDTKLDIKLTLSCGDGYDFINRVHLDNFTVSIPKGIHVSAARFTHYSLENGEHVAHEHEVKPEDIDNERGIVYLTREDKNTMLREKGHNDHDIHMILTFEKAIVGAGGADFKNNWVALSGMFEIKGDFRIESDDFVLDKLTSEQWNNVVTNNSFDGVCPSHFYVGGKASFAKEISVAGFSGRVESSVDDIAPIALDDLPDFLNDPEVRLDLENPVVFVEVKNPYPAEAKTGLVLTSNYDDQADISRSSGEIILPKGTSVLCVAEDVAAITTLPTQYDGMERVDVQIAGLAELLVKLPKTISVSVNDITMDIKDMRLPQQGKTDRYETNIAYCFHTPLELGENTKLVYQGVEEGLAGDLEDINTLNTKAIEINAVAETSFPLSLILSVDVEDAKGNSLTKDIVTVNKVEVAAHKGAEQYSKQDISLLIQPQEGHTISDLLKKMDKFVYRAEANGGGKLTDAAYLKLTNIKITLKGGISYDAN